MPNLSQPLQHNTGYILHTICKETKKVLFFTSKEGYAVSYNQADAAIYNNVEEVFQAGAEFELALGRKISASVNSDFLHGDKTRIKLSRHHHLCKQFPAYAERLQSFQEGKVISTRWSNVDGIWIVLAEIEISVKAEGKGKKRTVFRKVTCTQGNEIPTLLTAATIVPIKSNRMSKYHSKSPKEIV